MKKNIYPKISIVTPNLNQGQFLERTICSVLEQNYTNLEYIIIDGGSTDNSLNIINKYQKFLHYWISEPDKGQSNAINKGFQKATGEIWGWINSSDYYYPNAFKKVADEFSNNPLIDLIHAYEDHVDENENYLFTFYPSFKNFLLSTLFIGTVKQLTCFFRKDLFYKINGIDESLHYTMDLDLFLKMAFSGKSKYLNSKIGAYRQHNNQKTSMPNYHKVDIEWLFVMKRFLKTINFPYPVYIILRKIFKTYYFFKKKLKRTMYFLNIR